MIRSRLAWLLAIGVVALLLSAACSGGDDDPVPITPATPITSVAPIAITDCRFEIPAGQTVECFDLTVPEDRSQPDGPTIRLHVAIFRTPAQNPAPDPLVYLAGGPGGNALEPLPLIFNRQFAPLLGERDLIIVDQRGTGLSEPALDCPEVNVLMFELLRRDPADQDLSVEQSIALSTGALSACRDRLVSESVNLAAYTSAENAADLDALREALGYEQWNLYGVSYGSRLALTIMRDFPQGIRSVILDSTFPPQVDLHSATPTNVDRALTVLFEGCATDPACSAAYPALGAAFTEAVERLNDAPAVASVVHPLTGERFEVLIDGDAIAGLLFQSLYSTGIIPLLPEIIVDALEGNFDTAAMIQGNFLVTVDFVSVGMTFSVLCADEVPFSDEGQVATAADGYPQLQGFFDRSVNLGASIFDVCRLWGAAEADAIESRPVESDIPTLVLAGEYDPITPPAWGRLAAEGLSNSYFFEFPGVGHGVAFSGECAAGVLLAFLDQPTTEPDASCIAEMSGPAFVVSDVTLVPFTNERSGFSGVVPAAWYEIAAGTYSRSTLGVDGIAISQLALPIGGEADQLLRLLGALVSFDQPLEAVGSREASGLVWSLYRGVTLGLSLDVALAEAGTTSSYVILFQSTPGKRDRYYTTVFLPAIDALMPTVE